MSYVNKYRLWAVILLALIASIAFISVAKGQNPPEPNQSAKQAENTDNKKKEKKKKPKNKKDDVDEIGNRDTGKGINFYSLEKEIALGKSLAQEIERQAKLIEDPVIAEYVNRVGQNLVRNSDAKVPFTIKVIDFEEINALSLPGGFFFVNSGLVLNSDNEAQLAGAMAHEIAHVAARHGTRNATRGQIANIATLPTIFWGGWIGYGVRQAIGVAVPLGFIQFSKGFEREADSLGLQYLYKTGYDPNEFVTLFEKLESLQKKRPGTISKFFSTHPMPQDRIAAAQKEIQSVLPPTNQYVVNTSEFLAVKARLEGMYSRRVRKDQEKPESGRPTLRKGPGSGKIEPQDDKKDKKKDEDEDDRPVLKRR